MSPHDACVANEVINNKQHALAWHADCAKYAHVNPKLNDKFAIWCEEKYRSDDVDRVLQESEAACGLYGYFGLD